MPNDDFAALTAAEQVKNYVESFKNYGMLLDTMTPQEFAVEIGKVFPEPKQAAMICWMAKQLWPTKGDPNA